MFTLTQTIRAYATRVDSSRREALADGTASSWSYAELYARSAQRATELEAKGVGPGSTVAALAGNRTELIELLIATSLRGGRLLPLSKFLVTEELSEILAQVSPKVLYAEQAYLDTLNDARTSTSCSSIELLGPLSTQPNLHDALEVADLATADGDCWLATSSGSTGLPRIHRITHANLVGNLYVNACDWNWPVAGTYVGLAPLAHGVGFSHLVGQLVTGGDSIVLEPAEPVPALALLAQLETCWTAVVPTMLHDLVAAAKEPVASVKLIICAGSQLFAPLASAAQSAFPNAEIIEYYGSTEFGWAAAIRYSERADHPGAVGRPVTGVEIQVRDDEGTVLQAGEVGLVYKRGRPYSAGIVNGEPGDARFEPKGWQSAGDLGLIDSEGFLHLKDRRNDMIVTGGLNVYPNEVEQVILEHPDVRECIVVGAPDDRWGERVYAVLATDSVNESTLVAELDARCSQHLAAYKRPKQYAVWECLPRSAPGKTPRRRVRDLLFRSQEEGS